MSIDTLPRHAINRVRRETRRRGLTVTAVEHLTPNMRRIHFTSPDLHDFDSGSPDDHIKLFLPAADGSGQGCMRDYTPRAFDPQARTLVVDFALHDAGPATAWALGAGVGDTLDIGGPRGSTIVTDDFDWYLLIGDETALPAIGRRVEELRPGVAVTTVVVVDSAAEHQTFETRADWRPIWISRDERSVTDDVLVIDALAACPLPAGDGYVWIAAEALAARAIRAHVTDVVGHPQAWLRSSGYWVRGEPGASE
jgi:NADPH-dependent ferric siderophore reductase